MTNPLASRRALFWEIPEQNIEQTLRECDDWVIVRVFDYGTLEDIVDVLSIYGRDKAKQVLTQTSLKPIARVMAHLFLDVETTTNRA